MTDLLFVNGPMFGTDATALAVRGDRILAVGHDDVRELAGPRTEIVDLAGRLLVPGFQDAHNHAVMAGLEMSKCDLIGTVELAEYRRRIRAYAEAHPDAEWLIGSGWSMESFPGGVPSPGTARRRSSPTARPTSPTATTTAPGSTPRALERAGITAATPDPSDGRIERAPDGSPVGMLQEGAMSLVFDLVPPATAADRLEGLRVAQRYLHQLGVTAWQDALMCGANGYPDPSDAYLTAAGDGTLVVHCGRCAVVGPRARREPDPRARRQAAGADRRAVELRHGEDHAGRRRRELHRRDDRAVPATGTAT